MALFVTGSGCPYLLFNALNVADVIDSIKDAFAGTSTWTGTSVSGFVIGTFATINDGDAVQVGTNLYTFKSTLRAVDGDVKISGSGVTATLDNFKNAINRDFATAGSSYSSATSSNPVANASAVSGTSITITGKGFGGYSNNVLISTTHGTWNWGSMTPASPYTSPRTLFGGWRMRFLSEQGTAVRVYVFDQGPSVWGVKSVSFQVYSDVNDITGYIHSLDVPSPTTQLQVIVNGGTFWVSNPGTGGTPSFGRLGMSCCGGLLYVTKFGIDTIPSEVWWSSGDGVDNPFFMAESPRTNLYTNYGPNLIGSSEGVWAGTRTRDLGTNDPAVMRIVPKNSPTEEMITKIKWCDDTPIIYDPIVAWGNAPGDYAVVRGTIPDARVSSLPADADTVITDAGGKWMCYTNQYIKGGIWLLRDKLAVTPVVHDNPTAQYQKPLFIGTKPASA